MGKSTFLCLCFLLVSLCLGAPVSGAVDHSPADGTSVSKLEQCFTSQIGVTELTGRNDGKEVESYLKVCGLGKGYAWCAAFVCWNFQCADVQGPTSAWSPALFPASKTIYHRDKLNAANWQPGDVFGIYYPKLKRVGHVGFIESGNHTDTYTTTVEGNTNVAGSREGDGVYRKRRLTRHIYKVARYT